MKRIVVSGSLAFDRIMSLPGSISDFILPDQLDKLNVSFTVSSLRQEFGGTGGNCAYALGLLELHPLLVSAIGHDGDLYQTHLQKAGVDCSQIRQTTTFSAVGHVMTDQVDHQIWMFYPGAMEAANDIQLADIITKDDFVLLMPSTPQAFSKHLHEVVSVGADFLFDPAFFIPVLSANDLQVGVAHARMVIGNEYEMKLLQEKTSLTGACVIETQGHRGATASCGNETLQVPTAKVSAVDPTGAGDAFRAGLVLGLVQKKPLQTCMQMAMVSAAYCVESIGTQNYHYTPEQFWVRYKENYGES